MTAVPMKFIQTAACAGLLCLAVWGCAPAHIEGKVVDIRGEALPGVAVSVAGTHYQALTTARGEYSVRFRPGDVALEFAKSGYTSGRLESTVPEPRVSTAPDVVLWPLPPHAGVFILDNYRYQAAKSLEPQLRRTRNMGEVYCTTRWPDYQTKDRTPVILCHNMPAYGLRLSRLELVEIMLQEEEAGADTLSVWKHRLAIPVAVEPVDEPARLLLQVRLGQPLEPGTYAVHWGALEGITRPEPRIFLFSVGAFAEAPQEAMEQGTGEQAASGAPEGGASAGPAERAFQPEDTGGG